MKNIFKDIKWLFNYISSIVMYAVIVVLIGVGVLLLAYYIDVKKQMNNAKTPIYSAYVIISGSMEPIIKIQDAVLVRRIDSQDDVAIGDVVTYRSMDEAYYGILVTHRVVDIEEENGKTIYIMKGDHNLTIDRSAIEFGQMTGKVVMRIPKIGYLKYFLVSSYGWVIAIVLPSIAIVFYDIIKLIRKIHQNDKEGKVEV